MSEQHEVNNFELIAKHLRVLIALNFRVQLINHGFGFPVCEMDKSCEERQTAKNAMTIMVQTDMRK
jgi:hypothetical protein